MAPRKKINDYDLHNDECWLVYGVDFKNRKVFLDEDVDEITMGMLIRAIDKLDSQGDDPIQVYINTYGGSCYDGLALYDKLTTCSSEIHTIGMGKVMSMGTWLMLAGDKRFAYRNTTFMWHSISSELSHSKLFDIETESKEVKRLYDKLLDIYAEKSRKTKTFWRKWIKYEDKYGSVEKAMELGFVDEIIE